MLSDLSRDVRYALRALLRAPTFTATVVLTLSLGIGANSVIFSAVDAVLLRDAPVSDPESLVDVYTTFGNNLYSSSSYPDYFDLRDRSGAPAEHDHGASRGGRYGFNRCQGCTAAQRLLSFFRSR